MSKKPRKSVKIVDPMTAQKAKRSGRAGPRSVKKKAINPLVHHTGAKARTQKKNKSSESVRIVAKRQRLLNAKAVEETGDLDQAQDALEYIEENLRILPQEPTEGLAARRKASNTVFYDHGLNLRQSIFVEELLKTPTDVNGAARRAGYELHEKSQYGHMLLRDPRVKAWLQFRMQQVIRAKQATDERTIEELMVIAYTNVGDMMEADEHGRLTLKPWEQLSDEQKSVIKEISIDRTGERKVKFHDKLEALKTVLRFMNLTKGDLDSDNFGKQTTEKIVVEFVRHDQPVPKVVRTDKSGKIIE